ncbi:purine-nucleoside phosphorylase [Thermus thermamylovorans]|uniref:Uridine phosphorylase n=1 Tax=Thermus thermamylovorans TaxID=2509362 RepID=A0A4Q9B5K2_9DEIN|nr:purine-nucleoside phosphorylase [Thermus thermamylovorans]TBH21329.1 purine-nucleoside phosphorylase [Thermus thermamylovorans]
MSPIHVRGEPGDVAERVLLPGDPGRAEWIAKTFLQDPRLYTSHRGLLGFTGRYRGVPVSVQATGMGAPSASIVAEELVGLGARVLLRVGTCGAVDGALAPGDLVIAQGAVPLDGATRQYLEGRPYAPVPDPELFRALWAKAEAKGYPHHVGLVATEDAFYATTPESAQGWARFGVLAFEMEASALFLLGRIRGVRAGAILAVSNRIGDPALAPQEVLGEGVRRMVEVALEALLEV